MSRGDSLQGDNVNFKRILTIALAMVGAGSYGLHAGVQTHQHEMAAPSATQGDGRQLVQFPEPMRLHTITSMRDHLLALQEIDMALSRNDFDQAASVAEGRLGMSSLELHGAAHIAPFMPQGMQEIGTQMHRSASRFAVEAQNASVSNDVRPALAALGAVMQQCVACHATYRLH
jgi:hypothetical protein